MPKKLTVAQKIKAAKQKAFQEGMEGWCRSAGFPNPVFEHRFHADRKWRFDIAFPDRKVAVEIHGGLFRFGHHSRGKGFLDDREKMGEAQRLGWKVLEVAPSGKHPNTLYSEEMLWWLKAVL